MQREIVSVNVIPVTVLGVCCWAQRCGQCRNAYTDPGTSTSTFAQVSTSDLWLVGWRRL